MTPMLWRILKPDNLSTNPTNDLPSGFLLAPYIQFLATGEFPHTMTQALLIAVLLLPLLAAILQLAASGRTDVQKALALFATAAHAAIGLALVAAVRAHGAVVLSVGNWNVPVGIGLQADMLSALMVAITGLVGLCGAIHALAEVPPEDEAKAFHPVYQFLLFGVTGAFLTGDLFNLYVWFEVMLLSSFVLLAQGGGKQQIEGAVKYVTLNIVGSFVFLIGAGLLYATLGTLNFADIAVRLASASPETLGASRVAAALLFIAFATKAGMFPLYAWLPSSYHTPRHTVSAVFAGLLTKVGVYALFRVFGAALVSQREFFAPILAVLALLTMLVGVLGAASQFHTRRILSFHIISQIGYMVFALAMGTAAALSAGIFYVIHHILVKTNLFFAASVIDRLGGGEDLKHTGGLMQRAPWLALLFLIPAMSLGGIPPLSGFWAKFALLKEMLGQHAWMAAGLALAVGILTLFSMTKIWAEAFWKERPESALPVRPISAAHVVPMILLAACTLWLSFCPNLLFELAATATEQLLNPAQR